jgi:hypothetical protein
MKALEFEAQLNPDHTLPVPQAVAAQIPQGERVRVLVLVSESTEDEAWQRLTTEQFFKGYAESDAIYDQLPGG